eukprot:SAG31_NODE_16_length_36206_cov_27.355728_15_plen_40_part_00
MHICAAFQTKPPEKEDALQNNTHTAVLEHGCAKFAIKYV